MSNKYSIGILGAGFVGAILKRYYTDALVYDIKGEHDDLKEVLDRDVIFIAFNLKDNCRSQESYSAVTKYASMAPAGTLFIIKSTFVPGVTDALQNEFPQHRFIYNPEFLTEMTAWEDFINPDVQILGIPHEGLDLAHDIFELLPDAPIKTLVSPRDAEVIKHAKNSYYSLKVTFFNQLYDACLKMGADYETVRSLLVKDSFIGDSHSQIFHKGYRGFGGKCLTKDTEAFSEITEMPLLEHIIEYNNKLNDRNI